MTIDESTKYGNLSTAWKSYLDQWVYRQGLSLHILDWERALLENGWHALAAKILAEAVFAAAQDEDPALAQEIRDWLASKTAACFFEVCDIPDSKVLRWLEQGCPLPQDLENCLFQPKADPPLALDGIRAGLLTFKPYVHLTPAEIEEILIEGNDNLIKLEEEE